MGSGGKGLSRRNAGAALGDLLQDVGPYALAGLVCAIVLLLLFAKLTEEVFSKEITNLDNNTSLWIHGFAAPVPDAFFTALSTIGGTISITLLTVLGFGLLLWRKHPYDAWRLALVVVGGVIINEVLKQVFQRSRPDLWPGSHFAGFSFPSGHATLSFCLFGMFIWLGWRYFKDNAVRIAWTVFMVLLILLIGLSRIYLEAHFLSDVIAGYLSAAVWLVAVLSGIDIFHRLRSKRQQASGARGAQRSR